MISSEVAWKYIVQTEDFPHRPEYKYSHSQRNGRAQEKNANENNSKDFMSLKWSVLLIDMLTKS